MSEDEFDGITIADPIAAMHLATIELVQILVAKRHISLMQGRHLLQRISKPYEKTHYADTLYASLHRRMQSWRSIRSPRPAERIKRVKSRGLI